MGVVTHQVESLLRIECVIVCQLLYTSDADANCCAWKAANLGSLVSTILIGDLAGVPGSWLWPCLTLAIVGIWGGKQVNLYHLHDNRDCCCLSR